MSQSILNAVKSTRPTNTGFQREWYIVDASKNTMGRIASLVAKLLLGKNRADYSMDVDRGAVVVVTNVEKIKLTGQKLTRKKYYRHTGRQLKMWTLEKQLQKDPKYPLYHAIRGMLPANRQRDNRLHNRLHLIVGENHNFPNKVISVN